MHIVWWEIYKCVCIHKDDIWTFGVFDIQKREKKKSEFFKSTFMKKKVNGLGETGWKYYSILLCYEVLINLILIPAQIAINIIWLICKETKRNLIITRKNHSLRSPNVQHDPKVRDPIKFYVNSKRPRSCSHTRRFTKFKKINEALTMLVYVWGYNFSNFPVSIRQSSNDFRTTTSPRALIQIRTNWVLNKLHTNTETAAHCVGSSSLHARL